MICCKTCKTEKPEKEFNKAPTNLSGFTLHCKTCLNKKFRERWKSDSAFAARIREKAKESYQRHKVKQRKKSAEYYRQNRDAVLSRHKKYQRENAQTIFAKMKERKQKDPAFRVTCSLRSRLRRFLKKERTFPGVGCTREQLKAHIESLWDEGMTWENYGKWHIDHIMPCSAFDLLDQRQVAECFHYTNLQPLWAEENLRKSNKVVYRKGEKQLGLALAIKLKNEKYQ